MSTVLIFLSPLGERLGEGVATGGYVDPLTRPLPKEERSMRKR
jgi:hypothetical protein